MRILLTLLVLVALAAVFIWSGLYNVAAVEPHSAFVQWVFTTMRNRSIAVHSQEIQPPPLTGPEQVQAGFRDYHAMCFTCHGAPGHEPSEIGKGLNPAPPKLDVEDVQDKQDAELYWVIKNGIRMTGMPAFGPTHEEQALWSLVAFVRQLPQLKPQEYSAKIEAAGLQEEAGGHHHSQASPHQHRAGEEAAAEGPHTHEQGTSGSAEEAMPPPHQHEQGGAGEEGAPR